MACAIRNNNEPDDRNNNIGFRCAKTLEARGKGQVAKKPFARPVFPEFGGPRVAGVWNNGCS
jgi:hypothetical protein